MIVNMKASASHAAMGGQSRPVVSRSSRLVTGIEPLVIGSLCVFAAVRVFLFSAAFPFFNNVDEQAHFDLVMKYSHGYLPRHLAGYSAEAASYLVLYGSPEYFKKPDDFRGGRFPLPVWRQQPTDERARMLRVLEAQWQSRANYESFEPPLYYALAGGWLSLGRLLGLADGWLLYWLRFLNVGVATATVLVGARAAHLLFPNRPLVSLGVPVLLAVWPQTALYSVQPDALSPLCFGIAFLALIRLHRAEPLSVTWAIVLGLALAASTLTKLSNLPLVAIVGTAVAVKSWRLWRNGALRRNAYALLAFVACATVPVGAWFMWNYHIVGEFTATTPKMQDLTWTRKSIGEYWTHPIFTLGGLREFWTELLASFWRGEFIWRGRLLGSPGVDTFYWIFSTVALGLAMAAVLWKYPAADRNRKEVLVLALVSYISLVAFAAYLSIAIDFGSCSFPSRTHPYLSSGRLLNGAALPFFLLFAAALDFITERAKRPWLGWMALSGLALFVVLSQIVVNAPAFGSRYNFFHLWQ
jgi:hypothetical protein